MNLQDIIVAPHVRVLLKANGEDDRLRGISPEEGWQDLAAHCGYDPHERTPAKEAYLDGYHGVKD